MPEVEEVAILNKMIKGKAHRVCNMTQLKSLSVKRASHESI